jgi:Tol biopolymer transport system component
LIGRYAGWNGGIAWSRDSQRLVISRRLEGNQFSELDQITVSDGRLRKLPFGETGEAPAVSLRGDRLTFETWHYAGVDIWRTTLIPPGASPEKIIASTQASLFPQYSPDGKHIVFVSNRTGINEIWMSNADGTALVQISNFSNSNTGTPRWSPDGRKIAFDSQSGGRANVYIADAEERVPRKLATNIEEMSQPSWSHDGKWIYFIGGATSARIYRCPIEGGAAEALSSQTGSFPQEGFGGEELYFVTNLAGNPMLKKISLKQPGSEATVEGMPSVSFVNWAVFEDGIYFFPNQQWTLEYFDFATRKVNRLMKMSEPVMGLSVSQERRSIVYSKLQQADSDIVVVEHWR